MNKKKSSFQLRWEKYQQAKAKDEIVWYLHHRFDFNLDDTEEILREHEKMVNDITAEQAAYKSQIQSLPSEQLPLDMYNLYKK